MANLANLTGKKFGKLTAIKRTNRKNDKKGYYWLCKCECGGYKEATVTHLRGGNTKSCGCLIGQGVRKSSVSNPLPSKEESEETQKFIDWLDLQMIEKQLTNKQVADYSGLHPATIGQIRNHSASLTKRTANRIKKSISKVPSFKYPSDLDRIPYKVIMGGRFRVYSNGTVYRKNTRGLIREAKQSYVSRNKRYTVVTYTENGKQTSYYVHRLVAEAFIPNPEDKPQVNHKDGNPLNNNVENLEWVTSKENVDHAYEIGLIKTLESTPYKCAKCKSPTMKNDYVCGECKSKMARLKFNLQRKQEQRNRYKKIDLKTLKPRYRKIIKSRFRGDTLEDIGHRLGITRERVRQLEKMVMDKDSIVYTQQVRVEKVKKTVSYPITINEARKISGSTQEKFASELGVSVPTFSKYEKYKSIMPVDEAMKFSELVGIPFEKIDFIGSDVE